MINIKRSATNAVLALQSSSYLISHVNTPEFLVKNIEAGSAYGGSSR